MTIEIGSTAKISDAELSLLNDKLKIFGVSIDGRNIFRVAWAEDQLEKRFGEFKTVVVGQEHLKLGIHTATKEVPKYEWLKGKYVLEKLVPNIIATDVKTDDQLVYEMYIDFPVNKPPWFEAIVFFLRMGEGNEKEEAQKFFDAVKAKEEYQFQREVEYFEAVLAEGGKE